LVLVGNKTRDAIQAGLALTPLGEFSFVIAQLGVAAGILPPTFNAVAVGASLLTALAAPALTRRSEQLSQRIGEAEPALVRGWVAFYHEWLLRLRTRQAGNVLWRHSRVRLLHVAVHMLFMSALVLFAGPAYQQARAVLTPAWLDGGALQFVFWTDSGSCWHR
jgi:CPA2 family monovalent cation:H+ antiporter-2